jgi:hypothetical protein
LALIRWIGTEIRIFAYVKNLALLLCFLGFGMGCVLARRPVRWRASATALLGLLMVVRWPWHGKRMFEDLSKSMDAAQDIQIWASGTARHWPDFRVADLMVAALLLLVACILIPLGQVVSRQLELAARPLQGYSWNLAASLLGILTFFAVSWFALGPARSGWLSFSLGWDCCSLVCAAPRYLRALLSLRPSCFTMFPPLSISPFGLRTRRSIIKTDFRNGEFWKAIVEVNHTGYQFMVDLSPKLLPRHPKHQLAADSALNKFVSENRPDFLDSPAVPVTTDDWPYLYQQGRWLPGIFVSIELLVLLLGTGLYLQIQETRQRVPSLFFFSMGGGAIAGDADSQPPGLVFRPDLASERHCHRSHSRGVTGRQYSSNAKPNHGPGTAIWPDCWSPIFFLSIDYRAAQHLWAGQRPYSRFPFFSRGCCLRVSFV